MRYQGPFDACIRIHFAYGYPVFASTLSLSLLEPITNEVCSVESFRAALGISCTGAIAVINGIGKSFVIVLLYPKHIQMEEIKERVLRSINDMIEPSIFETVSKQHDVTIFWHLSVSF